jgi:hypothetical protein
MRRGLEEKIMKRAVQKRNAQTKAMPWLKHYDAGVPYTLKPYPKLTLMDIVAEAAAQRPDHHMPSWKVSATPLPAPW